MDKDAEYLQRRARREERRQRQRQANVGRARAMHTARLAFERRGESAEAQEPYPGISAGGQDLHIGCSGWFYWHWRSEFYPADLPVSRWFEHYASRLRTVELDAPFYSWPTIATVNTWIRQAGRRRFVYTVKASELITHTKRFTGTKTLVRDFGHIADLLGRRILFLMIRRPP